MAIHNALQHLGESEVATGGKAFGYGTAKPSNGTVGYCTGAFFICTNESSGGGLYVNNGTQASCDFDLVSSSS